MSTFELSTTGQTLLTIMLTYLFYLFMGYRRFRRPPKLGIRQKSCGASLSLTELLRASLSFSKNVVYSIDNTLSTFVSTFFKVV